MPPPGTAWRPLYWRVSSSTGPNWLVASRAYGKWPGCQTPLGIGNCIGSWRQGSPLERVTVPLGVLGVVFESRPDAVIQIAALALRSGNGAILKGGREALNTCQAIITALQEGLASSAVDPNSLDLLTNREETMALLQLDDLVDLIVPRGSNAFVRYIQENTRIPVLGHADGVCHLYVDQQVDINMAIAVALDAKTQYPAACNAIETLLVHRHVAQRFLPPAVQAFTAAGVRLRGDQQAMALGVPEARHRRKIGGMNIWIWCWRSAWWTTWMPPWSTFATMAPSTRT